VPGISSAVAGQTGAGLVKVSLTEFLDFVMASGTPRVTVVRDAKRRRLLEYDPRTDFYKPFRECVADMHVNRRPKTDLDGMMAGLSDPKKLANYVELVWGFKKFVGRCMLVWYAPPRVEWTASGLTVVVNPELHLGIEGRRHILKMYLKGGKIDKFKVAIINHLMDLTLDARLGSAALGVLCVRKGRLYEWAPPTPGLTGLLEGEAATFAQIYAEI
jgi:hypothetical protein